MTRVCRGPAGPRRPRARRQHGIRVLCVYTSAAGRLTRAPPCFRREPPRGASRAGLAAPGDNTLEQIFQPSLCASRCVVVVRLPC